MTRDEFQRAAGVSLALAEIWYQPVERALFEFGIASPARAAAFIAQIGHESAGFTRPREIWGPTPAQRRYEGRADLGNVQPGDGSRYRGRGLIQITGRANYAGVSAGLGIDAIGSPELLEQPDAAARSAAWWWREHRCNALADTGDFDALTRRINGGLTGIDDRRRRWAIARTALGA